MKCLAIRMISSACIDFDRALPSFCLKHVERCNDCRDFLGFAGMAESRLTACDAVLGAAMRSSLAEAAPVDESVFVFRAVTVAAAVVLLMMFSIVSIYLPEAPPAAAATVSLTDGWQPGMAEIEAGANLVLGGAGEDMLRSELYAWGDEALTLVGSIPIFSPVLDL